jgi:hypothetical protein
MSWFSNFRGLLRGRDAQATMMALRSAIRSRRTPKLPIFNRGIGLPLAESRFLTHVTRIGGLGPFVLRSLPRHWDSGIHSTKTRLQT